MRYALGKLAEEMENEGLGLGQPGRADIKHSAGAAIGGISSYGLMRKLNFGRLPSALAGIAGGVGGAIGVDKLQQYKNRKLSNRFQ